MAEKVDISKRILETRKQTEELKAQLQSLIDTGKQFVGAENHSIIGTSSKEKENKVQIVKSFDTKHSKHTNKPEATKNIPKVQSDKENKNQNDSPKKKRNYNVDEAREYIKKQREKRLEQLKKQNDQKIQIEIQKKKLQELHKKSLELVSKNIQAKRERSKSRDKNTYVRLDEKTSKLTRSRSVSREKISGKVPHPHYARGRSATRETEPGNPSQSNNRQQQPKNSNLLYPPLPDYVQQNISKNSGSKTENNIQIQNNSPNKLMIPEENDIVFNEKLDTSFIQMKPTKLFHTLNDKEVGKKHYDISTHEDRDELKDIKNKSKINEKLDTSFIQMKPTNLFHSLNDKKHSEISTHEDRNELLSGKTNDPQSLKDIKNKSKINVVSNITLRPASYQKQNEQLQVIDRDYNKITSRAIEKQMDLTNLEKCTKETQTFERKKEYPVWLQEQPAQAYPFNFISTVKRKLQDTVNSPKPLTDIRVQSSLLETAVSIPKAEGLKTREQLIEIIQENTRSSKKSENASFISSKCLNLDPKSVDHLELVPRRSSSRKKSASYKKNIDVDSGTVTKSTETDTESDTSKNIPDISSESGTSLKKNADSVKNNLYCNSKLSISTDKIDNMRLISHKNIPDINILKSDNHDSTIPSKSNSESNISVLKKSSNSSANNYEPDFHPSIEPDIDNEQNLLRSRESIISFNSPTYSKQIVILSPEYVRTDPKSSSNISTELYNNESRTPKSTGTSNKLQHSKNIPLKSSPSTDDSVIKDIHSQKLETNSKVPSSFDSSSEKLESIQTSNSSKQLSSLHTSIKPSRTVSGQLSTPENSLQFVNTQRGSSRSLKYESLQEIPPLKEPDVFLTRTENSKVIKERNSRDKNRLTKNISLRTNTSAPAGLNGNNQIHLKFEAEIHLLNDFNQSLRQFSEVEKVFETLKSNNDLTISKILQNQDTQTSAVIKSSTTGVSEDNVSGEKRNSEVATINYSRGSFIDSITDEDFKVLDNLASQLEDDSLISTKTDILPVSVTKTSSLFVSNENLPNLQSSNFAGLSLNMFDQLIKDEDARLDSLKTILKIREQVLLDRTKGELAWLEIQRKHFKETGKLQEASAIKRKQRGILVNHQKEKHEVQRLKQMQKAASLERKTVLKQQSNLIRQQLSTDSMLKTMKVSTPRERRVSGPLKVQNHSESIRSETSISRMSSTDREKEAISITSHHSVISKVSEISEFDLSLKDVPSDLESMEQQNIMKRTLLMRETALKKRKKEAEALLQWHKKLLEKEKRIVELESAASAIISQKHSTSKLIDKHKFKGKQLNQLWYNLTGCEEKKFIEDKIYPMSQMALERFCKSAREYHSKTKMLFKTNSDSEAKIDSSVSESIPEEKESQAISVRTAIDIHSSQKVSSFNDYMSDFDVESIEDVMDEVDVDVVDQSINLFIDNFSKIKEDISALSKTKNSHEETEIEEELNRDSKFEKSESEAEISVIETNRTSRESEVKSLSNETEMINESQLNSQKTSQTQSNESNSKKENKLSSDPLQEESIKTNKEDCSQNVRSNTDMTEKAVETEKTRSDGNQNYTEDSKTNTQHSTFVSETTDNLNESKEILLILGEPEVKSDTYPPKCSQIPSSLSTSEDILSRLSQAASDIPPEKESVIQSDSLQVSASQNRTEKLIAEADNGSGVTGDISSTRSEDENIGSESLELLVKISHSEEEIQTVERVSSQLPQDSNSVLEDISAPEELHEESGESKEEIPEDASVPEEIDLEKHAVDELETNLGEISVHESLQGGLSEDIAEEQTQEALVEFVPEHPQELSPEVVSQKEEKEDTPQEAITKDISEEQHGTELNSSESSIIISETHGEKSSSTQVVNEESPAVEKSVEHIPIESHSENVEEDSVPSKPSIVDVVVSPRSEEHIPSETKSNSAKSPSKEDVHSSIISTEDLSEEPSLNLSYGVVENNGKSEVVDSQKDSEPSEAAVSKEDINSYEEKELDSLSSSSVSGSANEKEDVQEKSVVSSVGSESVDSVEKSTKSEAVDVRERVSQIMADANQSPRGDRSPRLQDLYITTYDLISPANSPESVSPANGQNVLSAPSVFVDEAEEILKKQLAIEQEIKAITEQQKKEQQIPLMFVREIPNKPPPPYTPPSSLPASNVITIIPTPNEIEEITKYSAKILHKAYLSKNLENISISGNTLSLISKDISKECYKFVFDLCKEIAKEHYKQFEEEKGPSWLCSGKKSRLAVVKPLNVNGLETYMVKKLKEVFCYEKPNRRENTIIKWSRKKRDHVDEILVMESQAEEAQWTNYDRDELLVMNQITNEIMDVLLKDTAEALNHIFLKKRT